MVIISKFWIILTHTYLTKFKSKPFIITTILSLIILIGTTNIDRIIGIFDHHKETKIAVIDQSGHLFNPLKTMTEKKDKSLHLIAYHKSEKQAKQAVQKEKYQALVMLKETKSHLPSAQYYAMKITDETTSAKLQQSLQELKIMMATQNLGLNPEKVAKVSSPVQFNKYALDKTAKNEQELNQARVIVYVLVLLIYMTVLLYGSMIAMEIATEKSSRVMELIISSVSPVKHMLGKILAIGLLGLTQYAIFILVGYLSITLGGRNGHSGVGQVAQFLDFKHLPVGTIVYAVIFFLLGYFFYATMLAMIGSLVSRVEDVNQAMAPITMLVMVAFFIAIYGLSNPDGTFITVTSFIPFFTPMIMFLRVGMLTLPFWEIAIGIALMIVSTIILLFFGTRVYKGGVLSYQSGSVIKLLKSALNMSKHSS